MARPIGGTAAQALPMGTVTFLFSDIEGSTRLVNALGSAYRPLLERHQAILRAAFAEAGGVEVATEGDSFFVVFQSAPAAVVAAASVQRRLADETWPAGVEPVRVRIGLHTGEGMPGGDDYIGLDVHRAARISAAAHGGQVLMSETTRSLASGPLPEGLRVRDLGTFRLKDLRQPERLFQLDVPGLPDAFPPPRTLDAPSNLPAQATSFVGRDREIEAIRGLLGGSRLVTLLGPGGTGKTRLSLEVAQRLRDEFADGAFFVDLAPIGDAALVVATIAGALGMRERPGEPVLGSLEAHLRDRRLLVVLDNFEQVLGAAPLVGDLLRVSPGLRVLATSREALHVRGEQEYAVPPLAVPDPRRLPALDELARYEAVVLFAERARAVRADFEVDAANAAAIAEIAARLDGLPLAIELAAARIKLLPPAAILARLEKRLALLSGPASDLPARQRTLRGAIDWSHELLDELERRLFRRLGVFVGGWTIEDAGAVADPDGDLGVEMLDGIASLVDKSLVRALPDSDDEPRFGMLETIREYAVERLADSDDAEPTKWRHEDHFASLAARAESELLGAAQKTWLDRLEAERDNLRAALQNAAEAGRVQSALAMAASLWRYWQQRGHLAEGRQVLEGLLDAAAADEPTPARALALSGLGGLAYWQGDFAAAGRAYDEALRIERAHGGPPGIARALYDAGFVAVVLGDHATARADYEESLGIYSALGDEAGIARVREALVFLMFQQGELAAARELQEQNLRTFRASGEGFRLANALNLLSAILLTQGDLAAGEACQAEALAIFHRAGDVQGVIRVLVLGAALAVARGDVERAARISGAVDSLKEPLGEVATPVQILHLEDPADVARARMGDEAYEASYRAGRALAFGETAGLLHD